MGNFRLSDEAEVELESIGEYVANESGSLEISHRFVDRITERFAQLAKHPMIGRSRSDLRPGLRSLPVGNYLILYLVDKNRDVLVVHVMDGRRDVPEALTGD